ncbi:pyridoxamine 5'-phosphate oxidase family protein [Brachybacterium sp. AOP43-C2-M15]|uniref:pyridoxamine 5'-phosphate oxidase family protein n=1 Tax=Brachybacterium sp. AOP43-C2-M15 TaxID=3457661 RepID=UPI0040342149
MTETTLTQQDVVERLRRAELVMLTTALPDGTLLSHPMAVQGVTEDADVWFFVGLHGGQADALRGDPHVNLAVAEAGSWLSVAGRARFVEDRSVVEQLWNDGAGAYFPGGPDDPDLGLLEVSGDSAQFWGLPGGKVAGLAQIVKSRVLGDRPAGGTDTTEL